MCPAKHIFSIFICITLQTLHAHSYFEHVQNCLSSPVTSGNKSHSDFWHFKLPPQLISPVYLDRNISDVRLKFAKSYGEFTCDGSNVTIPLLTNTTSWTPLYFIPGGQLRHDSSIYDTSEFCVESASADELNLIICKRSLRSVCLDTVCIPKCCDIGEVLDISELSDIRCTYSGKNQWVPVIYSDPFTKLSDKDVKNIVKPKFQIYNPADWCGIGASGDPVIHTLKDIPDEKRTPFRIFQDGTVKAKFSRFLWTKLEDGKFCLDGAINFPIGESEENPHTEYTGLDVDTVLFDCSETFMDFEPPPHRVWYGSAALISAACLLMTLVINFHVMDNKKSHRKTILAYIASLLFMQISLGASHLLPYFADSTIAYPESLAKKFCIGIGIGNHFFYILTFTWMTAVSFDVWMGLRNLKALSSESFMRFVVSGIFAFGLALSIVITGVVLDHVYRDDLEGSVVIPEYGQQSCFLEPIYASLFYVYIPVGFLIMANIVFFILTVLNIWVAKESNKDVVRNSTNQPSQALMILKLCIIMGIPFTLEIISWALTKEDSKYPPHFIVADLFLIMQGVAILYVFCFASGPRILLLKKYPKLQELLGKLSVCTPSFGNKVES